MSGDKQTIPSDMPSADEAAQLEKLLADEVAAAGDDSIVLEGITAPVASTEPVAGTPDPANPEQVADGKGGMIPKARFDEVIAQRDKTLQDAEAIAASNERTREENEALKARLARLEAGVTAVLPVVAEAPAARDFDAEYAALQEKYDDGDLTLPEFTAATRKLTLAEVDYKNALANHERGTAAVAAAAKAEAAPFEQEMADTLDVFLADNPQFKDNPLLKADFQAAIKALDDPEKNLSAADLIAAAEKAVLEARGLAKPAGTASTGPVTTPVDEVAKQRLIRNALRAAGASSAPPLVEQGQGNRDSGMGGTVDVMGMERDDWARLSQAEQNKLLGITK